MFSAASHPVAGPGRDRRRGIYSRDETHKVFGAFEDGTAVPFGDNARSAGFDVGQPIGQPMPFEIFRGR